MKKSICMIITVLLLAMSLFGCAAKGNDESPADTPEKTAEQGGFAGGITVLSREEGSGTRSAFIELTGVEVKDENGDKKDMTTDAAEITNSTAVMKTTVGTNKFAIGYISLGALDKSVKAVKVEGAEASKDAVKDKSYKLSRPFNIVTKESVSAEAQDFINFILSDDGQKIAEDAGYISTGATGAFKSENPEGKITVGGSSSVTPLMEKLVEAYNKVNPKLTIEVQLTDSSNGIKGTIEGTYDIGMASRELKDDELYEGVKPTVIAMDGIAVVVNAENPVEELTLEQIAKIYKGEIKDWSEIG